VNPAQQKPADELRMSSKAFDRIMRQALQVKPKLKKAAKAKPKPGTRKRRAAKYSTENKTVPVAIVNEFVDGDIYRWGSLMAGALVGSLPLVILYAFFVEHYVSAMTGAVKE
jgi:hypothetical protein